MARELPHNPRPALTHHPPNLQVAAPLQWGLSIKVPQVQATLQYPHTDDRLVLSFEHVSLQLKVSGLLVIARARPVWFRCLAVRGWSIHAVEPLIMYRSPAPPHRARPPLFSLA